MKDSVNAGARPKRRRWLSLFVVLGVIAAMGWLAWSLGHRPATATAGGASGGPPGAGGPGGFGGGGRGPATTVGTAKVEALDIPVIIEALGTVTPLATVTVRPQVSGVITEVRFREGQIVNRGDVLAVIDRRPFQMALLQAVGALKRDQADLDNAQLTLDRYKTLQGQDSIAQQDVDTQASSVKQLEGTVVTDRAAVGSAQLDLDFSEIKAPVTGRTGLRVIDAGNYIAAGDANGVVVITQLSPTDVEFTVPQDRVAAIQERVAKGAALPATALDRTRTITLGQGTFSTLDNLVNTETGTVRAKARFENKDGTLFPSQFVNLRLTLTTVDKALVVPVSAVRNSSDGDFVFVLGADHTAIQRRVKRGATADDKVQIIDGVQLDETVITEGGDRLKDGARVQLPGDKPGGAKPVDKSADPSGDKSGAKGEHHKHKPDGDSGSAKP